MWSDNESEIDLLRASYLARAVAKVVREPDLLPVSIGVFGDWGSGKSTILRLVEKELQGDHAPLLVKFNGWLFEGTETARAALMGSLLDCIEERVQEKKGLPTKVKELVQRLWARINLMELGGLALKVGAPIAMNQPEIAGAVVSIEAAKQAFEALKDEDPKKLVKDAPPPRQLARREIAAFREDFAALLGQEGIGPLVVLIDDLDRCLPATIIEILEAIKLFLFVPGTAFVVAADERVVGSAARTRFPGIEASGADIGRVYLEKLIQIPISIPPLTSLEIESYMSALFVEKSLGREFVRKIAIGLEAQGGMDLTRPAFSADSVKASNGGEILTDLAERLDLVAQVAPVLAPGLEGSPRRTKRFLNAMLLRLDMAADRKIQLKPRVLAKLMALEYVRPDLFTRIAVTQARHDGEVPVLVALERRPAETPVGAEAGATAPAHTKLQAALPGDAGDVVGEDLLADKWTQRWVASEPPLAGEDLRPYFYVARERTGLLEGAGRALTVAARKALANLLAPGDVAPDVGLKEFRDLSAAEAAAVVEHIASRTRSAGDDEAERFQLLACRVAGGRADVAGQVLMLLEGLPEPKISRATPMTLWTEAASGSVGSRTQALVTRWSQSTSRGLATAAKAVLARPVKR